MDSFHNPVFLEILSEAIFIIPWSTKKVFDEIKRTSVFFAQLLYFSPRTIKIPRSVSELQQKSSIFIKEHLTFHESFFIGDDHWVCDRIA